MSAADETYPAIVLGGSGYVAGEFLRLIDAHPRLTLGAVVSTSQAGEPVAKTFTHLAPAYPSEVFVSIDAAIERLRSAPHWLVLSGAPHGASAQLVEQLLGEAGAAGVAMTVVDASADFRFAVGGQWA
jgi:N-acetyl-gamma-glutamyl-phosphate reductase